MSKINLFNKTRKEFHDELLISCHDETFDDYTPLSREDIKKFSDEVKEKESEFLKMHFLETPEFEKMCFSLKNTGALIDSFSYTSYLYLISAGIFQKGSLNPLSKAIKKSKEDKENDLVIAPKKLESISDEIVSSMICSNPTPENGSLNDIINEVLNSVKQETGGQDLSNLNISPADILGSVSSKNSNDKLKKKTGIDFGNLISNISAKIEGKVAAGDLDISALQKMFK